MGQLSTKPAATHVSGAQTAAAHRVAPAVDLTCFCGTTTPTITALHDHAISQGHRIQCCCGKLLGTDSQLKSHQRSIDRGGIKLSYTKLKALHGLPGKEMQIQTDTVRRSISPLYPIGVSQVGSHACRFCTSKTFKDDAALSQHMRVKHPACPICQKLFHDKYKKKVRCPAHDRLVAHQQSTGHGYCAEHKTTFGNREELERHNLEVHGTTSEESINYSRTTIPGRPYQEQSSTSSPSIVGHEDNSSHIPQRRTVSEPSVSAVSSSPDIADNEGDKLDDLDAGGVLQFSSAQSASSTRQ